MPSGEILTVCCPRRLQISDLPVFYPVLVEAADRPEPVRLEASEIERADAAALQLLTSFVQTRREQGRSIEWHAPSAELVESAELLGLKEPLGLCESDPCSDPTSEKQS
ncbi:MAG: STAS domain-containing protein [Planctomycetota bacterium]